MKLPRRSKEEAEETPEAREQRRRERTAKAEQAAARAERRAAKASAKAERRDKAKAAMRSGRGAGSRETSRAGGAAAGKRARGAAGDLRRLGSGAGTVLAEALKLVREMLVIPAQLWIAVAEVAGSAVLTAWRRAVRPALVLALAASRATLRFGERHVTPARAVTAVALTALAALAISQWLDYHSVSVGTDAYSGDIQVVAPAPEVESAVAGDAHGWVMLPLAAAGLAALGFGLLRRPRAAHLLILVGVVAIAISLIVDAPKGLDEGDAAIAYQGAKASLLEGFWLQIAAGAVLIACGLMLPGYLRPARASVSRSDAAVQRLVDAMSAAAKRWAEKGLEQGRRLPRRLPRRGPRLNRGKRKAQGART